MAASPSHRARIMPVHVAPVAPRFGARDHGVARGSSRIAAPTSGSVSHGVAARRRRRPAMVASWAASLREAVPGAWVAAGTRYEQATPGADRGHGGLPSLVHRLDLQQQLWPCQRGTGIRVLPASAPGRSSGRGPRADMGFLRRYVGLGLHDVAEGGADLASARPRLANTWPPGAGSRRGPPLPLASKATGRPRDRASSYDTTVCVSERPRESPRLM